MKLTETQIQEGDLIVKRKGDYTIEQLADDFRHWASKRLNQQFGSTGSFVNNVDLGYEILLGVGFGDYEPVGRVEIEANNVVRISVNPKSKYSGNLPLEEYKPFLN
jgi:hypothetical protein